MRRSRDTIAFHKAHECLVERRAFSVGSPDWKYLTRAAWKLLQMAMGKHHSKWTDIPPGYRKDMTCR